MIKKLTLKANAKINIGLNITGRRCDGYHEIETLMHSVSIFDILEFTPSSNIRIVSDTPLNCGETANTVYKCIEKISAYTKAGKGMSVSIKKNIPIQAGMGGGSADGAAALIAFNELYSLSLTKQELSEIGSSVGADIPFTVYGGCGFCTGVGEKIKHCEPLSDVNCLIVKPDIGIDTKTAYSYIDKYPSAKTDYTALLPELYAEPHKSFKENLHNAFEKYMSSTYVSTKETKDLLYAHGAFAAGLTGSGSAFYGLFDDKLQMEKTVLSLNGKHGSVYSVQLCSNSIIFI